MFFQSELNLSLGVGVDWLDKFGYPGFCLNFGKALTVLGGLWVGRDLLLGSLLLFGRSGRFRLGYHLWFGGFIADNGS